MSAPLKLTAADLQRLASFLAAVTEASAEHGVTFGPYGPTSVQVTEDATLAVSWTDNEYVIDDQSGT